MRKCYQTRNIFGYNIGACDEAWAEENHDTALHAANCKDNPHVCSGHVLIDDEFYAFVIDTLAEVDTCSKD